MHQKRSLHHLAAAGALALCGAAHAVPVALTQNFESCSNAASCGYSVSFVAEGSAASVNVRAATNTINSSADQGFDNFFGSRFLTIGDNIGNISGEPNGQDSGGLSRASFGLGALGAGRYSFRVGFDHVFDTNAGTSRGTFPLSPDDFLVRFETGLGTGALANVLSYDNVTRNSAARRGAFSADVSFMLASSSNVYLSFSVAEFNGTGSSAAGIDNLRIHQIAEPGALALSGLALIALAGLRRRA